MHPLLLVKPHIWEMLSGSFPHTHCSAFSSVATVLEPMTVGVGGASGNSVSAGKGDPEKPTGRMSPCAVLMPPGKTSTSSSSRTACRLLGEGGTMSLKRSENARTYKGKQGSLQKCERKRDLRIPVHQRGHLCFYFFFPVLF